MVGIFQDFKNTNDDTTNILSINTQNSLISTAVSRITIRNIRIDPSTNALSDKVISN